jgi:autotransporter adhesin
VNPTDAVNYQQFSDGLNATNNRIDGLQANINALSGQVNKIAREERSGIAGVAAMANLPYGTTPGKWSTAASLGGYRGETAFAGGFQYNTPTDGVKIRASASYAPDTNDFTWGAGVGWEF